MGVWQGVAMDSVKFHSGPPCLTLLRPAGRPPLKRPSSTSLDTPRRMLMGINKERDNQRLFHGQSNVVLILSALCSERTSFPDRIKTIK
jgi:hypothetical protein